LITPIGSGAALQAAPDGGEHEGAGPSRDDLSAVPRGTGVDEARMTLPPFRTTYGHFSAKNMPPQVMICGTYNHNFCQCLVANNL
jgi:hypothetical protein